MKISFPEHHLFQILKRFEHQHLPLDLFLSHYFKAHTALGSKDRHLIAEAVYGMSRWKSLLDYLSGPHPTWEQRYALFRSFQPASYLAANAIPLHVRLSFPQELFALLETGHGREEAISLCQASNTEAPITIRVNPLKAERTELLSRWQGHYDIAPCDHSPYGIQFKKGSLSPLSPNLKKVFLKFRMKRANWSLLWLKSLLASRFSIIARVLEGKPSVLRTLWRIRGRSICTTYGPIFWNRRENA